jgi:hypothetical protein
MVLKPESFSCIRQAQAFSFGVRNPELSHGVHSPYLNLFTISLRHAGQKSFLPLKKIATILIATLYLTFKTT